MELCNYESESVWYVPDYRDNREMPEDEQFAVRVVPMSHRDYQQLEEKHGGAIRNAKVNALRRYHKLRADVITRCVLEVEHLTLRTVRKGGAVDEVEIKTGAELVAAAPGDMLEDILGAIKDTSLLTEGVRGKSDSLSDSSG
jgi:hypothetical protein